MRRKFWLRVLTALGLIGLVSGTAITGIVQVELDLNQFFYHKALAFTLLSVILIHLVLNRKVLAAYFRAGRPARSRSRRATEKARPQTVGAASGVATGSVSGMPRASASPPQTRRQEGRFGRRSLIGFALGAGAGWAIGGAGNLWGRGGANSDADSQGLPTAELYDPSLRYHQESRLGLSGALREVSLRVFQRFQTDPPPLYKRYPEEGAVLLPPPSGDARMPVSEAIGNRRSRRAFASRPLPLQALSDLTHHAMGITGYTAAYGQTDYALRAAPSSGAKYPVELYALVERVEALAPGLYHYQVAEHALARLRPGSHGVDFAGRALAQEFLAEAAVVFVLTGYFARSASRYGSRAYRYAAMDAGHIGENLYLTATALGLSVTGVGAFFDDQVNAFLDIDGRREAALYLNAVGFPA